MNERDQREGGGEVCSDSQEPLVVPAATRSASGEICKQSRRADPPRPTAMGTIGSSKPSLVYSPKVRKVGAEKLEILGSREDEALIAWGFWGSVILALLGVYILFFRGSAGLHSLGEVVVFSLLVVVGMVLAKLGRRSSLRERVLMEVDLGAGALIWPTGIAESQLAVSPGEVEAVLYGLTDFSVSSAKNATPVQAFAVSLRDRRGEVLPVIEASPDKEGTHQVASLLASLLQMPVTYVGRGVEEEQVRRPGQGLDAGGVGRY